MKKHKSSNLNKSNTKMKRKMIIGICIFVLGVIFIISGIFIYGYFLYSKINKVDINKEEVLVNGEDTKEEHKSIINIALFGTDTVDGTRGLSDCNMILSLNSDKGSIKLCSIMRDTYVEIPGHGENIINMAMMDGGPELALKTINYNFNLAIDKFIAVNLESLPKIVDKIGGLNINVKDDELQYINSYIRDLNKKNGTNEELIVSTGNQLLNGTQVTAYCRIRYTEGTDFKRTERQRFVLKVLFNKMKDLGINKLSSFLQESGDLITTNISYYELLSLGTEIVGFDTSSFSQNRFPSDGDHWSTGTFADYKLHMDKEITTNKIHQFIYD